MKKPKIILAAICLLAAAGGALASKARFVDYFVTTAPGVYVPVTTTKLCPGTTVSCTIFTFGANRQLFKPDGNGGFIPQWVLP